MQAIGTPASSSETIVVPLFHSLQRGELVALRAADGAVVWRAMTPGIYEAPAIWRDTVLVAEAKGTVAAFDLRNGTLLAQLPVASELYGHGLALDGDRLFIAGRGALWAYRLQR
jgi:outer membrane protein assembly factor BamB